MMSKREGKSFVMSDIDFKRDFIDEEELVADINGSEV